MANNLYSVGPFRESVLAWLIIFMSNDWLTIIHAEYQPHLLSYTIKKKEKKILMFSFVVVLLQKISISFDIHIFTHIANTRCDCFTHIANTNSVCFTHIANTHSVGLHTLPTPTVTGCFIHIANTHCDWLFYTHCKHQQ